MTHVQCVCCLVTYSAPGCPAGVPPASRGTESRPASPRGPHLMSRVLTKRSRPPRPRKGSAPEPFHSPPKILGKPPARPANHGSSKSIISSGSRVSAWLSYVTTGKKLPAERTDLPVFTQIPFSLPRGVQHIFFLSLASFFSLSPPPTFITRQLRVGDCDSAGLGTPLPKFATLR